MERKTYAQSRKLDNVCYDIRGPVMDEAMRMEARGASILKLNIGNPAPFGFSAPDEVILDLIYNLRSCEGYSDSQGLFSARKAIMQYCQLKKIPNVHMQDIFTGNGVSELITMTMQGLLNDGDEILVPSPDYPLWTASVTLAGGTAVHYICDEQSDWFPDIEDLIESPRIAERIGDAQIVVTNKTPLSRETLDRCPGVRAIAVLATGYNVVDIAYAKEKGIPVMNVPVYGTYSVSQFTIALLLEICHHIGRHSDSVHAGKWAAGPEWCYWETPLIELEGKTFGLLGCGNIGMRTAAVARALGMQVITYDHHRRDEALALGVEYVTLDELFARSDVLALQMPLRPFNTGIINKDTIAGMKDGVILLNNSRGQMIVEQDLAPIPDGRWGRRPSGESNR